MPGDEDVVQELKKVVRLLSMLVTRDVGQREQIQALSSAGFTPKEIADLIGTTPNTVSVTLSTIRREASKGRPRARVQHD